MIMFEEWITEARVWEIPRWDVKKLVERYLRDSEVLSGLWPGRKKNAERKKTMLGSGDSHNTEVLNCQQSCENDVIKGS